MRRVEMTETDGRMGIRAEQYTAVIDRDRLLADVTGADGGSWGMLRLLASGKRNAQIADDLVVSRWTIDHHVSAILRKLGAHTRGEAVATATTRGYLES